MKKNITLLLLCFTTSFFAQSTFKKGYIINKNNQKIECFIKDLDWLNSPKSFEYKLSEDSKIIDGNLENVIEFGIENLSIYKNVRVQLDEGSDNLEYITPNRNPNLKDKIIFLKQLVGGNANLYKYTNGDVNRFFYSLGDNEIKPLIYNPYLGRDNKVAYNLAYQQELFLNFDCEGFNKNKIKSLEYKQQNLTEIFNLFNNCKDPEKNITEIPKSEKTFQVNIRPQVNFTNLKLSDDVDYISTNFENKINFGLGAELEYNLPFNNKKWAFIFEPTYKQYKVENENFEVKKQGILLPIGIRYYIPVTQKSKVFFNANYIIPVYFKNDVTFNDTVNLEFKDEPNFGFGLGYNLKNKYALECRVYSNQKSKVKYGPYYFVTQQSNISLIFSYRIF